MRSVPILAFLVAALALRGTAAAGETSVDGEAADGPDAPVQERPVPEPAPLAGTPQRGAPAVHAARAERAPTIDGRLDDPAWIAAPVFAAFVLNQPTEGGAGSERTELRVLFDDEYLYVGFHCSDTQPATISRGRAPRDTEPATDYVAIFVDAGNDGRTARRFYLNAASVQADTLIYDDIQWMQSWDAVWDGAATVTADGWSAEYAIPLHVVGVDARQPRWGFLARRYVARTHELV